MNRRGFFATLAGLAAIDPDKLVWTPGKLISIPARAGLANKEAMLTARLAYNYRLQAHAQVGPLFMWDPKDKDQFALKLHQCLYGPWY